MILCSYGHTLICKINIATLGTPSWMRLSPNTWLTSVSGNNATGLSDGIEHALAVSVAYSKP